MEFYSLKNILACKCQYNLIIGERSNGKTYAALLYGLREYWSHGAEMAYIRRWKEDMRGNRAATLFKNLEDNGEIAKITEDKYDRIVYYNGRWYLGNWDEKLQKSVRMETPFCYGFSLSDAEHDKSTAYPRIKNIIFDEFLTRQYYLPNEFVTLMNVLSTIIRHRNDVTIFMLANTVNKYAPYFKEMGLSNVDKMKPGKIDIYSYGNSNLRVAVELCKGTAGGKKSDDYFAFNNPALQMITGGMWEIDIHPHLPMKYKKSDIVYTFFVYWQDQMLQADCVNVNNSSFIYFHRKTSPIQNEDVDLVFKEEYDARPNIRRNIRKGTGKVLQVIAKYFKNEKVFYQDNEVGELVRNYLMWCTKTDIGAI